MLFHRFFPALRRRLSGYENAADDCLFRGECARQDAVFEDRRAMVARTEGPRTQKSIQSRQETR
jgi:hypothetical protein